MVKGIVFDIKEMSVNDGPGLRTSIFFKGCPLRCSWCHNPEGMAARLQLKESGLACQGCGKCRQGCGHADCAPFGRCLHVCPLGRLGVCGWEADSPGLAARVKRQSTLLMGSGGGVTLTGGEPLAQGEFLLDLMAELKPLHVAVETCACADGALFGEMLGRADLVLADIKHMDDAVHRRFTGAGNGLILENIGRLMASGKPFIIRVPLIPRVNDGAENLGETARFLAGCKSLLRVELMPYNVLAGAKYRSVGMQFNPGFDVNAAPNADGEPFELRGIPYTVL